eukprot:Nk52_evm159s226 gene=Nk52_evmTU159s226
MSQKGSNQNEQAHSSPTLLTETHGVLSPRRNRKASIHTTNLSDWSDLEECAECMIPLIGRLYRNRNVVCYFFGRSLINQSSTELLKAHSFAKKYLGYEIVPYDTLLMLKALHDLENGQCQLPVRVDIGQLLRYCNESVSEEVSQLSQDDDVIKKRVYASQIQKLIASETVPTDFLSSSGPTHVVLYGFGRIGRLLARILLYKTGGGEKLVLKAVVVRKGYGNDLEKRASLLRRDSVHGQFHGTITVDNDRTGLIINGNFIQFIYSSGPDQNDYTKYGIDDAVVIDNTGTWRDREGLGLHLKSKGVAKVILTAPPKGSDIPTIVSGVNYDVIKDSHNIYSAASCTTNAITPILRAILDKWNIESGHIETVHSYTNDQNLIDNYHAKSRRGRSAALNMVITETGAGKAVVKCIPELEGKLTANAIRVPTPNVSMAILILTLDRETSVKEVNSYLRGISLSSNLQEQVDYIQSDEVVSSDFVGNRHTSIVDAQATVVEGKRLNLYVWYDNEYGYSCQVIRLLQRLAGISQDIFPHFPVKEE